MGDKLPICGIDGGRVCTGGLLCAVIFCIESFPLSEMGDKFPIGGENFPTDGIDGALEKEEGIPTCS